MGSPPAEPDRHDNEPPHRQRIARSFAIASKAVTVAQFKRFLAERPDVRHHYLERHSPEPDGPIIMVTWYEAAQYCNWLSEREGLPLSEWCYPPHADIKDGMKPIPDYLKRTGYRLPTEAEWEYASRAGSRVSRFFGSDPELLGRYVWQLANSQDRTWPVGQKRPNDLGMFDVHGNSCTWLQEAMREYQVRGGNATEDVEDRTVVKDSNVVGPNGETFLRGLRGGTFLDQPRTLRASYRLGYPPSLRSGAIGLRVARTY